MHNFEFLKPSTIADAAKAMAAEGATVWATDIKPELLKSFDGHTNIHTAVLDVLDKPAIHALVKRIEKIDAVFNCAGFVHSNTALDATDEQWDFAMNLNARAQFWMIQAVLPNMLANGGGSIINLSSIYGLVGAADVPAYHASKGAVRLMSKSTAVQHAKDNIRANSVHPGVMPPMRTSQQTADPVIRAKMMSAIPMGREGRIEEVASANLFLASDDASYITGAELAVDGGYLAQ